MGMERDLEGFKEYFENPLFRSDGEGLLTDWMSSSDEVIGSKGWRQPQPSGQVLKG